MIVVSINLINIIFDLIFVVYFNFNSADLAESHFMKCPSMGVSMEQWNVGYKKRMMF